MRAGRLRRSGILFEGEWTRYPTTPSTRSRRRGCALRASMGSPKRFRPSPMRSSRSRAPTRPRCASSTARAACRCGPSRHASEALAAELAGSSFSLEELPAQEASSDELPAAVQRAARRARSADVLLIPIRADDVALGSLELLRASRGFDRERACGRTRRSRTARPRPASVRRGERQGGLSPDRGVGARRRRARRGARRGARG